MNSLNRLNDLNVGHRMPLVIGFSRKRLVTFAMGGKSKTDVKNSWGKNTLPGAIALSCYCALTHNYCNQPIFLRVYDVEDVASSLRAINSVRVNGNEARDIYS